MLLSLGLLTWPWQKNQFGKSSGSKVSSQTSSASKSSSPQAQSFDSLLNDILEKAKREGAKQKPLQEPTRTPHKPVRSAKITTLVFVFIFFVFLIAFFAINFDDENSATQSPPASYLQLGAYYLDNNMFDSAYIYYKYALKEKPDDVDALFGLGNTLSALNKPDSAIVIFNRILQIDPALVAAAYSKGWIEYRRKNYTEATRVLKELVNTNPEYLDAMQLLGDIYYEQGVQEEALQWYEKAYIQGQHNHWICYVMGYLYQEKGNTQRAIDLYKESLSYDSSEVDIYKRLGELLPGKEGDPYRTAAQGETQW